jgi:thioredoxin-related protein
MQFTKGLGIILITIMLTSVSCSTVKTEQSWKDEVENHLQPGNKAVVLAFWSAECPLCMNYTKEIQEFRDSFSGQGIDFLMVYPGEDFSDEVIRNYLDSFEMDFDYIRDTSYLLTHEMTATVTPQVVVLDSNWNKLYSGKIDNWIVSLGKKRQIVTEYYLKDALEAIGKNEKPKIDETKPVGCLIE